MIDGVNQTKTCKMCPSPNKNFENDMSRNRERKLFLIKFVLKKNVYNRSHVDIESKGDRINTTRPRTSDTRSVPTEINMQYPNPERWYFNHVFKSQSKKPVIKHFLPTVSSSIEFGTQIVLMNFDSFASSSSRMIAMSFLYCSGS